MQLGQIGSFAMGAFLIAVVGVNASKADAQSQVFRCTTNGVVTFSDRPCGTDAEVYASDEARTSTFTPAPIERSTHSAPRRATRSKKVSEESLAASQAKHAETCARIDRSLHDVRSKMRAGYHAKQGERLNERHRKLTAQRREQKC